MSSPLRFPIAVAKELAPPAEAAVAGRVTDRCEETLRLTVTDISGTMEVETESVRFADSIGRASREESGGAPALGDWVRADGIWRGRRLEQARVRVETRTLGVFPREGGDWQTLQASSGQLITRLQSRSRLRRAIREFFDDREFLEVETPLMVPSPGLDVHLDAFVVATGRTPPRYLSTSPEYQMKRLLVGGLPRIYQLGRAFRREELGSHHEPEFSMLEWYRVFSDSEVLMRETEELVAATGKALLGVGAPAKGLFGPVELAPPWQRLTLEDVFQKYAGVSGRRVLAERGEDEFFQLLAEHVQPRLGRGRPVFVTHWPASMASLARIRPDDPSSADRFEAYIDGVELCNGFGELTDATEQRKRFTEDQRQRQALGKPIYPVDERFLEALEEGMPPCAGNALGVDRLLMLLLGIEEIGDTVAIPWRRL